MLHRSFLSDNHLSRRTMLRGLGVAISLPALDAMRPAHAAAASSADETPRRMVAICAGLGMHAPYFFPEKAGRNVELPRTLNVLKRHRNDFTVFSGVSHPDVDGAHNAEDSFLSAAPHPGGTSFRNSVSIDQLAAESIGHHTRFPSLTLTATGTHSLSVTRDGISIPGESKPSRVFAKLFLTTKKSEKEAAIRRIRQGRSILDTVREDAADLHRRIGPSDRHKVDEYTTAVRELERRMTLAQEWERKPKPKVNAKPIKDVQDSKDIIGRMTAMFDLAHLAFQTDSTRLISIMIQGRGLFVVPPIEGVTESHHGLSHHGQNKKKLAQLAIVEAAQMGVLSNLLDKLKSTQEDDQTLLDRTMVFFGSNLGNASSHDTRNLPILLAGGGFKHGQHLAFDTTNNYPLPNLYVSMLQRLGLEVDHFVSSTGTMRGLEFA